MKTIEPGCWKGREQMSKDWRRVDVFMLLWVVWEMVTVSSVREHEDVIQSVTRFLTHCSADNLCLPQMIEHRAWYIDQNGICLWTVFYLKWRFPNIRHKIRVFFSCSFDQYKHIRPKILEENWLFLVEIKGPHPCAIYSLNVSRIQALISHFRPNFRHFYWFCPINMRKERVNENKVKLNWQNTRRDVLNLKSLELFLKIDRKEENEQS